MQAANAAGVQQFVLVTSLGTGKVGFPAGERPARLPLLAVAPCSLQPVLARPDLLAAPSHRAAARPCGVSHL